MGKMKNAILLAIIIELSLYLVVGSETVFSSVLQLFFDFELYDTTNFLAWLIPGILTISVGAVIVGVVSGKADWVWRAGLGAAFMTFMINIIHLGTFIASEAQFGESKGIVAAIILIPLILFYVFTVLDYITGKD